jgi:D-alanine-D-alanine ligase
MAPSSATASPGVQRPEQFGRVAVLLGGRSRQRELSLQSGSAVLSALKRRGLNVLAFDPGERALHELMALGVDRAWIALHGPQHADGSVQGALEILGLPFSGSGVLGSAVGADKLRTKWLCDAIGVPTARCVVLRDASDLDTALDQLGLPLYVKPARQEAAIGISRVEAAGELRAAWQSALSLDPLVFAEPLVPGAEYTVAILQGQALPSIRIEHVQGETRHHCPSGLSGQAEQHIGRLALAIFEACGAAGWGSADFRMDRTGRPLLLEINTVPLMSERAMVPLAARAAGIGFDELVWRVLETSLGSGTRH